MGWREREKERGEGKGGVSKVECMKMSCGLIWCPASHDLGMIRRDWSPWASHTPVPRGRPACVRAAAAAAAVAVSQARGQCSQEYIS